MLLEVDRRGDAEVEVEELGGGQVVEVAVVEGEVGSSLLFLVGGDGVEGRGHTLTNLMQEMSRDASTV